MGCRMKKLSFRLSIVKVFVRGHFTNIVQVELNKKFMSKLIDALEGKLAARLSIDLVFILNCFFNYFIHQLFLFPKLFKIRSVILK